MHLWVCIMFGRATNGGQCSMNNEPLHGNTWGQNISPSSSTDYDDEHDDDDDDDYDDDDGNKHWL